MTLPEPEREALAARLRAEGRPAGAWVSGLFRASPTAVLAAALGLRVRASTAALIREGMNRPTPRDERQKELFDE